MKYDSIAVGPLAPGSVDELLPSERLQENKKTVVLGVCVGELGALFSEVT
jgi:hypothetical protein